MRRLLFTQVPLALILSIITASCQPQYPTIEDLLVDVTVFPDGWYEDIEGPGPDSSAPWGGIRSVERTTLFFHSPTAGAVEQIERFSNHRQASQEFDSLKLLSQDEGDFIPSEPTFQNIVADQYHFACILEPQYPYPFWGCIYLAQYGTYLVNFNFDWNLNAMSAGELKNILRAIDDKMAPYTR